MGFLRRAGASTPKNLGAILGDFGRCEFYRPNLRLQPTTDGFISSLQRHIPDDEAQQLIAAIHTTGLQRGGWAACGAWEVLLMNMFSTPQALMSQLSEVRVRFLLGLNEPDVGMRLNVDDMVTLKRIDPDAYARISPY